MAWIKRVMQPRGWHWPMLLLALLLLAPPAGADVPPWRGLFQDHCGACHDRAGPLVEETLTLAEGDMVRRRDGSDLGGFLARHVRRLSDAEVGHLVTALTRIANDRGQFVEHCGLCHASAKRLAQSELILRGGVLWGRYSGRDIAVFLRGHGRLDVADAAFFTGVLERHTTARD